MVTFAIASASTTPINFDVDVINDYFLSISFKTVETVPLSSKSTLSYLPNFGELEFRLSTVSVSDVISILSSLDSGKATGCDELSLRFLSC